MDNLSRRYYLHLVASVFVGLSLLLVVVNGALALVNRVTQADVNARAQYINESVQLGNLEQAIARAAATAAVNNKDTKLGDLLVANGIRYQFTPNAAPAGAAQAQPVAAGGTTAPAGGGTTKPAAGR